MKLIHLFLLATGFHRPTTHEEMVDKFGPEIVANEKIVNHISGDASQMTKIGVLPSGGDCIINKLAVETELLISEGFINHISLLVSLTVEKAYCQELLLK